MQMRFPLFAAPPALFGYSLLEIAAFIFVGGKIGVLPVLALILCSAALGAALFRRAKSRFFTGLSAALRSGRPGEAESGRRLLSCLAALLLIIPGLISSLCGLILALPPAQDALLRRLKAGGAFRARFSFAEKMRGEGCGAPAAADLKAENYHAADPENSPWRKI